jgi:branched-chain amino acid transport system substrate-binding protein
LNNVVAVIGPVTSGNGLAVKPLVAQYQTPLISPTGTAITLTEGNEFLSRVCFIDPYQGKAAAVFANDQIGKKAVIMYDTSNDYSTGLAAAFENEFVKLGGTILQKVGFKAEDKDFTAQLTQIKELGANIIYIPSYHPTAGPILNQAAKLGIAATFMGGDGWDSAKLQELAGAGYPGNYFTTHFSSEDTDPMVQNFVKNFKKLTSGMNPGAMAALGYDAALILSQALERTIAKTNKEKVGSPEFKTELKNQINATKDFKGVTGTITLDENRNAIKSVVIIKTTPEGPQFFGKINPEKK